MIVASSMIVASFDLLAETNAIAARAAANEMAGTAKTEIWLGD
jgi:hypothetical protein